MGRPSFVPCRAVTAALRTDSICASCVNNVCVLEPPADADPILVDLACPNQTLQDSCDVSFANNYCSDGVFCDPGESCLVNGSCGSAEFACGTIQCPNDAITVCDETNSRCTTFNKVCPDRSIADKCVDTALFLSTMNIDAQGYKTDDGKWVPVVPGIICDGCRKHRGSEPFMLCSRCNLAYFCSQDCFAQAWTKGGHKQQCRKEGEIKVGDVMALDRSVGEFSCGTNVELIAREVEEHEGHPKPHWFVQPRNNENTGEILEIEEGDLRRIRAALWNVYSSELYPRNEFEQNS